MSAFRCPNCDRPALETEITCVRCGAELIAPIEINESQDDAPNLRRVLGFLVVIIGLIAVSAFALSRANLSVEKSNSIEESQCGDLRYSVSEESFEMCLPADWSTLTDASQKIAEYVHLIPVPKTFRLVEPHDITERIVTLAVEDDAETGNNAFISVQFHPNLARNSLVNLQNDDWEVADSITGEPISIDAEQMDGNRSSFRGKFQFMQEDTEWYAITLLVPADDGIFALTAVTPMVSFSQNESTLNLIVSSFQPLDF